MEEFYTDLNDITLSRFIDIYLGDTAKTVREGASGKESCMEAKRKEAAARLCAQYLSIVGGRAVMAQISRRNEMLSLQMRMACLDACRRLAKAGGWDDVLEVMAALGYRFGAGEHERMIKKLDSLEAYSKYRMDKLRAAMEQAGKDAQPADRAYFTRERVAVMQHMKMHIDPGTFTAAEYAWMVRRMCDELESLKSSMKKQG